MERRRAIYLIAATIIKSTAQINQALYIDLIMAIILEQSKAGRPGHVGIIGAGDLSE